MMPPASPVTEGRRASLVILLSITAALVLLPLGLAQPGLPIATDPAQLSQFAAAVSLATDGDLRCGPEDVERLFQTFPYAGPLDLVLHPVDDGGPPAFVADPLFTLLATPLAGMLGFNGILMLVAGLFAAAMAAVAGLDAVREDAEAPLGIGFAVAFFAVSAAMIYALRSHPASLYALLVATAFGARFAPRGPVWRVHVSGLCLGLAVVPVPIVAPLAPALLVRGDQRRTWLGAFLAGLAAALGLAALVGAAPFADGAAARYVLASPHDLSGLEAAVDTAPFVGPPDLATPLAMARSLAMVLVERRSGLLPYFPFVLVISIAAAMARRRNRPLLLGLAASIAAVAWSPALGSDDPGGSSFADPRWVALYPAFAFLLIGSTAKAGRRWITLVAVALGVISLGPALVSTLGPAMAWGSPQGHSRGVMSHLPIATEHIGRGGEWVAHTLAADGGPRLWRPRYASEAHGDEIWILGGQAAELFLDVPATDAATSWVVQSRSFAADNRVRIRMGEDGRTLHFGGQAPGSADGVDGSTRRTFEPGPAHRVRSPTGPRLLWPLRIDTSTGVRPAWVGGHEPYFVGVGLSILGSPEELARDLYSLKWLRCAIPPELTAGQEVLALVSAVNTSSETWPARGAARVRWSHRWLHDDGTEAAGGGTRLDLPSAVAPGEEASTWIRARAPRQPGRYTLAIEPLFENVAWFSDREVEPCRAPIDVRP